MFYYQTSLATSRKLVTTAPLFAILLISGCQKKQTSLTTAAGASSPSVTQSPSPTAATPEANVFVDEAMLARPYAIIGGTVQNVGAERLEKLSVEIELRRREDGSIERREVSVEPGKLEPGEQGRFKLKVLSEEWSGSRVVRLRSGSRTQEVTFKSLPGAKRPPEKIEGRVVNVTPPARKKSDGSEFINTPDTPYKVP
jgi:hypothetical protein